VYLQYCYKKTFTVCRKRAAQLSLTILFPREEEGRANVHGEEPVKSSTVVSSMVADFEIPALATRMSNRSPTVARTCLASFALRPVQKGPPKRYRHVRQPLPISATTARASPSVP
jgi:hypothetical protein